MRDRAVDRDLVAGRAALEHVLRRGEDERVVIRGVRIRLEHRREPGDCGDEDHRERRAGERHGARS
jgi:hypothetical protein